MRDKLDGLSDFLVKLSRFPGLGFLEGHAESLVNMKHQVEGHISSLEAHKQGVEEGFEAVREVGPKSKQESPPAPSLNNAAYGTPTQPAPSSQSSMPARRPPATAPLASKDAKMKQKLARSLQKRTRR